MKLSSENEILMRLRFAKKYNGVMVINCSGKKLEYANRKWLVYEY